MDNNKITWKWNPVTEEWELPEFPKKVIDNKEESDIIHKKDKGN